MTPTPTDDSFIQPSIFCFDYSRFVHSGKGLSRLFQTSLFPAELSAPPEGFPGHIKWAVPSARSGSNSRFPHCWMFQAPKGGEREAFQLNAQSNSAATFCSPLFPPLSLYLSLATPQRKLNLIFTVTTQSLWPSLRFGMLIDSALPQNNSTDKFRVLADDPGELRHLLKSKAQFWGSQSHTLSLGPEGG